MTKEELLKIVKQNGLLDVAEEIDFMFNEIEELTYNLNREELIKKFYVKQLDEVLYMYANAVEDAKSVAPKK